MKQLARLSLKAGDKIIDLGGTCEIWDFVETPLDVTIVNLPGVDVKPAADSRHSFHFVVGDATRLDYDDNHFDLVFSNSVIEHVGGEKQEQTEWHRVAMFGKTAEIAGEYLKKGSQVYIEGKLQTRKWTDKEGQERYTTEVVIPRFGGALTMLDGRSGSGGEAGAGAGADEDFGGGPPSGGNNGGGGGRPAARGGKAELDDDIPF